MLRQNDGHSATRSLRGIWCTHVNDHQGLLELTTCGSCLVLSSVRPILPAGAFVCGLTNNKVEFVAEKSVLTVSGKNVISQVTRLMSDLT